MTKFIQEFENLCTPVIVYIIIFVIRLIYQIMGKMSTIIGTIITVIIALIWIWLLNYICKSGYTGIAWVIVLLQIIF